LAVYPEIRFDLWRFENAPSDMAEDEATLRAILEDAAVKVLHSLIPSILPFFLPLHLPFYLFLTPSPSLLILQYRIDRRFSFHFYVGD